MPTYTVKTSDLIQEGFDFGLTSNDYPIFDETYREALNKKILEHYWNYEIGQETESMFRFSLNRKMREIMPLYNQRYKSTQIEFDPLQTVNYLDLVNNTRLDESVIAGTAQDIVDTTANNTEHSTGSSEDTGTTTGEGTTTSTTLGKSRSVSSETPQVQLAGNEDYASSAADVNSNTEVTGDTSNSTTSGNTGSTINDVTADLSGNTTQNSTNNSSRTDNETGTIEREVKGSQGPAAELLIAYRASFLNIDMEIISELGSLFMQIWDNGDEFTNNNLVNWSYGYGFGLV